MEDFIKAEQLCTRLQNRTGEIVGDLLKDGETEITLSDEGETKTYALKLEKKVRK